MTKHQTGGRPRREVTDFPGVDWNRPIVQLCQDLGIGSHVACRLRREARELIERYRDSGIRPSRPGRRHYTASDYPGVDWSATTQEIMRQTGLSRPVVYRLLREVGLDPGARRPARRLLSEGET